MDNPKSPFDTYHIAPISYDKDGRPVADAPFTDTSDTKRYAVIVPPEKVIPVIFVPGIMGSNLELKKTPEGFKEEWGKGAWQPDNNGFMKKYWKLLDYQRRRLLDPTNTEIDNSANIEKAIQGFSFNSSADGRQIKEQGEKRKQAFVKEMRRRGWGTVMVNSYGPLLAFLEKNMNHMYWRGELNDFWRQTIIGRTQYVLPTERTPAHKAPVNWGITKGDKRLTAEDVKKAARYWYPVHAVGYNWLQSNVDSGKHLSTKIDEFIAHYRDKLKYECEKVILVTHSMGGLVARAAVHPEAGKATKKVVGIIHGVMPTHGAAAAYRRCHAGFEGGGFTSMSGIASKILGADGPEVAAVFSNSPGALELLPSKLYGMGWLEVRDNAEQVLQKLPKVDPYQEIYAEKKAWWRLMNPDWVDPKPIISRQAANQAASKAWDRYIKNLSKAEGYHAKISDAAHPCTHIHCGADSEKHRAFGTIRWRPNTRGSLLASPLSSQQIQESKSGTVHMKDVWMRNGRSSSPANFEIAAQDEAGDGTVPRRSGAALAHKAKFAAEHTGYDHQDSYKDKRTQELVAYGIARIVSESMA